MAAAPSFVPRLLPTPWAAAYLGVSETTLRGLPIPRKIIGGKRLYDRLSLDVIDAEDIEAADARAALDRAFGVKKARPEGRVVMGNGPAPRTIPAAVRREVFARDGEVCRYCGAIEGPFHLDHVFPVSRGGAGTIDNLAVACAPCNLEKSDRTPEEWMEAKSWRLHN